MQANYYKLFETKWKKLSGMMPKMNIEILTNIFISFHKTIQWCTDREGEKTAALVDQILTHLASATKGLSCSL